MLPAHHAQREGRVGLGYGRVTVRVGLWVGLGFDLKSGVRGRGEGLGERVRVGLGGRVRGRPEERVEHAQVACLQGYG